MSRTRWIVVSVAAIAAGLFAWTWRGQERAVSRDDHLLLAPVQKPKANLREVAIGPMESAPSPVSAASPADYAAAYRDAGDLLAFLNSLAPAADRSDANALYWMFRASRRCTRDYSLYLGGPERSRSLERALAVNLEGRMDEKSTREIYARCATFKAAANNPYRDWRALLVRASRAGSSIAKATLADETRIEILQAGDAAGKSRLEQQMRSLARDALRSKDPAVLMALSVVAADHVKPTDVDENGGSWQVDDEATVWAIAACQRGYDCSVDNEDFRYICQMDDACQPFDTVVDILLRHRPEKFPELELRATELNAKLDADRFDDIDL
jgi:hypothetical protein